MSRCLYKMEPRLLPKIWGGRRLQAAFGKDFDAEKKLGESWEVSGLEKEASGIAGDSRTLDELFAADPEHLLGSGRSGERFPMLIKLLATEALLSVQVHPDDEQALALEKRREGKWECWTILEAAPGAEIFLGLADGVSAESFFRQLEGAGPDDVKKLLRRVEVEAGDFFVVPPGTIHAIGAHITLLEVQQPSDVTYRVYDWDREEDDGTRRPLHLEQARLVIDDASRPEARRCGRGPGAGTVLWDAHPFRIERLEVRDSQRVEIGSLSAVVCLGGRGRVCGPNAEEVVLEKGESCIVAQGATILDLVGGPKSFDVALITARNG